MKKSVLLTGAGSGIGEATALHLDQLGYQVFAGVFSEEQATNLSKKASTQLTALVLDITDPVSIATARTFLETVLGNKGLQGLFNNAGIATGGPSEFLPMAVLRDVFEVNFFGHVMMTQAFLPLLRQGKGRVINMISVAGFSPLQGSMAYCASKHAMEAFTSNLHLELKKWGIDVVGIEPAAVNTPIIAHAKRAIEAVSQSVPAIAHTYYAERLLRPGRLQSSQASMEKGISSQAVATVVARALSAKRPRLRYRLGKGAKLLNALYRSLPLSWFLPLVDRVLMAKPNRASTPRS